MIQASTLLPLLEAAHSAPSADNSQPWRFAWDGQRLSVLFGGDRGPDALFGPASPATLLTMGGAIENLYSAAEYYGYTLSADPNAGPDYPSGRYLSVRVEPPASGQSPARDGCRVFLRHTNRFGYQSDAVSALVSPIVSGAREAPARLVSFDRAQDRRELAELAMAASRIRFRTRVLHEWLARSLRYTADEVNRGDGLDVRTLDLPPAGGAFLRFIADWRRMQSLNRIGAYRAMAAIEGRPIRSGPLLLAVVAPADPGSCIAAGRLMTRVWTQLNGVGLAVHPYYGIPDQMQRLRDRTVPRELVAEAQALDTRCRATFALADGEMLHMLLRVGHPRRDARRSLRRPLSAVLDDHSAAPA